MAGAARGIQSIEVGGRILDALSKATAPMMLRDLAATAGLTPAQSHAYLTSFRHTGLVEQDAQTGQYSLGNFAMRLAIGRIQSVPLLSAASRAVEMLSERLGHMALMVVWGPHGPTIVQVQAGASTLAVNIRLGTLFSVTGSASGHVFAAYGHQPGIQDLADAELKGQPGTPSLGTVPDRKALNEALARTRDRGYASTVGAPIPDISAVSAPVFDAAHQLALAITFIGRSGDLSTEPDAPAVQQLLTTTTELSGASDDPAQA